MDVYLVPGHVRQEASVTPAEVTELLGPSWTVDDLHVHSGLTYWRRGSITVTHYAPAAGEDGSVEWWVKLDDPTADEAGEFAVADPVLLPAVIEFLDRAVAVASTPAAGPEPSGVDWDAIRVRARAVLDEAGPGPWDSADVVEFVVGALEGMRTPAEAEIVRLNIEVGRLRAELDEAQLRSIEARNPGIDLAEVRTLRRGGPS